MHFKVPGEAIRICKNIVTLLYFIQKHQLKRLGTNYRQDYDIFILIFQLTQHKVFNKTKED